MQSYGQFCPVAVAAEVFAQRWTPLILRELFSGASQFNEIRRCMPLIPKTTLAERLKSLELAGVITGTSLGSGRPTVYRLTASGEGFRAVIEKLGEWGQQSETRFEPQNLNPELLMWNVRRRLDVGRLPAKSTVVRFEFSGLPASYRRARIFWLKIDRPEVDLCLKDPGSDVDLYLYADFARMARVWLGEERMDEALRSREVRLVGPRALVETFPSWLLLSHFAAYGAAAP